LLLIALLDILSQDKVGFIMFLAVAGEQKGCLVIKQGCDIQIMVRAA
jgi:hypothetical protein